MQMNDSAVSDWPTPSSPRPFRADPHPLSPAPSQLPTPGEGERSANRLLACLPLLPVWGVGRGREKRAGVMRVLGGGGRLLFLLLLGACTQTAEIPEEA